MRKLLDYSMNHSKDFAGMTDYEKWEYKEDVIAGIKDGVKGIGACIFLAALLAWAIFVI